MNERRVLPALGLALCLLPTPARLEAEEVSTGTSPEHTSSSHSSDAALPVSVCRSAGASEDMFRSSSGLPRRAAEIASLELGGSGSGDGIGLRFSFGGSGIRLLHGDTPGPDMFSDGPASESPRVYLRLKSAALAGGRHALTSSTAWRYAFYSPEMNLLSETELRTTAGPPVVLYEYVWFNGHPVAQVDTPVASPVTHWTFTDHLGTPIIQTSSDASIYWQAEYEPFGRVFALRTVDQHQPLRLPGQEAEQLNLGANGVTERSYNISRWYRSGWGRYSQADPVELEGGLNLFAYVRGNPATMADPLGLCASTDECPCGQWKTFTFPSYGGGAGVFSFGIGKWVSTTTYTCRTTGKSYKLTSTCRWRSGIAVGVNFGFGATVPFTGGACGCNKADLMAPSKVRSIGIEIFSVDRSPCAGTYTGSWSVGIFGKGFGLVNMDCTTTDAPSDNP